MNKTTTAISGNAYALQNKKLFLFDIDGTIAVGNELFDGSRELIEYIDQIGGKAYYITNNSTRSSSDYVRKFKEAFGLETVKEQFITSGYMTIRFLLKNYKDKKIFVMGTASFISELRRNGLCVTEEVCDDIACVVAAYDSELTYRKLTAVCEVLSTTDVPFYATNPDLRCPIDFGFIPDCGAMCKMIEYATGRVPVYLGKPDKEVVGLCMKASGFSKDETIVIGDRLYTDIACGINAGTDTCVVFTGEATPADMKDTKYPATYEFENIRKFYEAVRYGHGMSIIQEDSDSADK